MVLRRKNLVKKNNIRQKEKIMKEIEHLKLIDLDLMYSLGNHWRWNNGKFFWDFFKTFEGTWNG